MHVSVGADLRVSSDVDAKGMCRWVDVCHDLVRRMRASPKPLQAAVHGTANGGGLEIVLPCDVRFAASTARLGQPEINIGFIPPVGATQALARLLDRPRALRFFYAGTLLSAEEAHAIGLVDVVVAPERLREEVQGCAEGLPGSRRGRWRSGAASPRESPCPSTRAWSSSGRRRWRSARRWTSVRGWTPSSAGDHRSGRADLGPESPGR